MEKNGAGRLLHSVWLSSDGEITYYIFSPSEDSHTIHNNRPTPFFHPPEQTMAARYTQYFILCTLDLLG
jgi:hypothetical protein